MIRYAKYRMYIFVILISNVVYLFEIYNNRHVLSSLCEHVSIVKVFVKHPNLFRNTEQEGYARRPK